MKKKVLIIEDTIHDLSFYRLLFKNDNLDVSFLFVSSDTLMKKGELIDAIELLFDDVSKKIRNYLISDEKHLMEALKKDVFDVYIFDSLKGLAKEIVSPLPKKSVAFLSSTESFRNVMAEKGYRVYKKNDILSLIDDMLV